MFEPPFLWTFTAPGDEPSQLGKGADDVGPPCAIRDKWIRQSAVTLWGVGARWKDAEPKRLPDTATEGDFDWATAGTEARPLRDAHRP